MNLCSDGHEEVCYESRKCPVCEMETEKDAVIEKLSDEASSLEENLRSAQQEADSLREE